MRNQGHRQSYVVALVPARGGSKGLPRKNLRRVGELPLVAYSIRAGLDARLVDATFVSTDDSEIAEVAKAYGARVIPRPLELADDHVQNDAVAIHALKQIAATERMPDVLVLLQPTSPLRTAAHVDECLEAFLGADVPSAMSICEVCHHPGKYIVIKDGLIFPFTNDDDMEAQRQELAPVYRQNGAIYVIRVPDFLASHRFYRPPCRPYLMSDAESIDIDSDLDLQVAELRVSRKAATKGA